MIYDIHASGKHPYGPIERLAYLCNNAKVCEWDDEEKLNQYTIWQLQQLRRVAKVLAKFPWRDSEMRAEWLLIFTRQALITRGAWT